MQREREREKYRERKTEREREREHTFSTFGGVIFFVFTRGRSSRKEREGKYFFISLSYSFLSERGLPEREREEREEREERSSYVSSVSMLFPSRSTTCK